MSRSRKKTWKTGNCGNKSEKDDKRAANRRFRRIVREQIKADKEVLVSLKEISDIWTWAKDGKSFFVDPKFARK